MKKLSVILILGLILSTSLSAQINYPLKSGSVKYTMNMMGTDNIMTLYFDNNGNTQCSDMEMEMFGMKMHTRNIIKDKKSYALDMTKKTYTEQELSDEDLKKASSYFSDESMLKEEGVTKLGDEVVLDKNCQVYSMNKDGADTKLWTWKGLMLKMEATAQGMTVKMIATSIDESAPEQSMFEIPSDFTK